MEVEEVALTAVWLAVGIVAGFVIWTYVGPMLTTNAATTQPTA